MACLNQNTNFSVGLGLSWSVKRKWYSLGSIGSHASQADAYRGGISTAASAPGRMH